MSAERDLYEPIRKSLVERFRNKGGCQIEITAHGISEEMKSNLPDQSVMVMAAERRTPDLIGFVSKIGGVWKRRFVVEAKKTWLNFADLYQVKMYADLLLADWAFLISPQGFRRDRIIFLKNNYHMLSYYAGNRSVTTMILTSTYDLEVIDELTTVSPFDFELSDLLP
jgi:hypothetical protein